MIGITDEHNNEKDEVDLAEGIHESSIIRIWRRRADSNRCIEVLQTSPLTTWVRRPERIGNMILLKDSRIVQIVDNSGRNT